MGIKGNVPAAISFNPEAYPAAARLSCDVVSGCSEAINRSRNVFVPYEYVVIAEG
jgi:hypothetical protein